MTSEGTAARRAALRMLDAVLRKAQTIDNAAQSARGLPAADAALAVAIAGETLRRLPDLDALIDSATRQRLPGDSKARMVLRLALAQKAGLGTPDHAVVATAFATATVDNWPTTKQATEVSWRSGDHQSVSSRGRVSPRLVCASRRDATT